MAGLCGLLLDSARCIENRAYYCDLIHFAAERGVNTLLWHFTDDQGCTLQFDSVHGIASPYAYSKAEMAELIAFAKGHGIQIIPELASLGHSRYITNLPQFQHLDEIEAVFTGMCPVAPETREVLAKLVDETAAVFDAHYFHVGLDEANIGHHPLSREALQTRTVGQLIADHINFMHGCVRAHGRTMMMWGDGLLKDRTIAPLISRDIVICDWQYRVTADGSTTQYFLDEGFRVVLCPALISHGQPLFPGDQLAFDNLRAFLPQANRKGKDGGGEILGVIDTVWQPERYMHDAIWMGMDLAIAMMRDGCDISIGRVTAKFVSDFYGFTPAGDWIDSARKLYELMPLRKEWLAVLQMKSADLPGAISLKTRSRALATMLATFAKARPQVMTNTRAYDTFCLMIRVLAHLYHKAEVLGARSIGAIEAKRLIADELRLIDEVEATWDRERFADDPNKFSAARECFRDNNLLANLRAMHATTVTRLHALVAPTVTISTHLKRSGSADAVAGHDPLPVPN